MGSAKSKARKLNPKTVKELQTNLGVDFTREEIEEWFREYQATLVRLFLYYCHSGIGVTVFV